MKRELTAAALVIGASLASATAGAEDESTEDLDLVKLLNLQVSTATKTAETMEEAPAVIAVVTRADIQRWGYQTLAEVLTHTAGFYLIDDHILPNAGVRGMTGGLGSESGVIKVMIDGSSVAYRTSSSNWLGVELIPLGSVAQIEIIRGPASALYGADAFLGVVNIITLEPDDLRPIRARAAWGATEGNLGGRLDLSGGTRLGKFDVLLGAGAESTDRSGLTLPLESPAPTLPSGIGDRRTALDLTRRSLVLQGRLGYRDVGAGQVVFSAYVSRLERGGDFARWAQLTNPAPGVDTNYGTVIALGQLRLTLDGLLRASSELDLSLSGTYFEGGVLPADRIEIANDDFYLERSESYRGVNAVAEARWHPAPSFNAIAGVETVYDRELVGPPERVQRGATDPLETNSSGSPSGLVNVGAYLSSNLKLIERYLKVTGGLRYDHHDVYGDQLTGRLGLTSRWSDAVVSKLLYGSAFKAPSPYLSYASPLRPGDVVGNPALKPQRIHTVEYQVSFKPNRLVGLTSGVSYNWLLDKAEFTPIGINLSARNVATQRSLSWETRLDLQHYHDYAAYLSFDLVHSVRELGNDGYAARLVGSENVAYPPWIARAGATLDVPSLPELPIELGARGMLVAARRAADASLLERGENFSLPAYLMLDVWLATRELYLIPGHESRFALRSRNLLVERGPDPGFSGFEYPLAPAEIFAEFEHMY